MSDIRDEIETLMQTAKEVTVAIDDTRKSLPFIASHPTIYHNGKFYILSSDLARQTYYYKLGCKTSVIITSEATIKNNLFSRKRLTMECNVKNINKNNEIRSKFDEKLGIFASGLFDVDDFKLFEVTPVEGLYFRGFGRAFEFFSGCIETIHVKEPHKPKKGNTMAKILKTSLKAQQTKKID
ncbi:hypothetical protein [Vibrio sp. AND4]|uniref:hypothetical protein n=1 Tax=Vibrio sp. AND4 TaxID=314289 RepID=UPI00015F3000|nr:hypothetical protein [Vibrio sp. AND4]EDP60602.1 hypothetical protein AND4_06779 [Vibrio sp. AND4]